MDTSEKLFNEWQSILAILRVFFIYLDVMEM